MASVIASTVPSAPSATGQASVCAAGSARRIPSAAASDACREERLPFMESIAVTIFICPFSSLGIPAERPADLTAPGLLGKSLNLFHVTAFHGGYRPVREKLQHALFVSGR